MQDEVIQSQSNSLLHSELPICYPFVRWAGGKTQLLANLDLFIPSQFSRYFEPFLGGGALFFYLIRYKNKPFVASYVSDINSELINSYLVIRNDVEKLIVLLEQHQIRYKRDPSKYYYQLRKMDLEKVNRYCESCKVHSAQ